MTTLNPSDKSSDITLSGGDLIATDTAGSGFANVRSTTSKTSGKHYFEATWATAAGNNAIGVANASASLTAYLGSDANSKGWYDTGFGHPASTTFAPGDVTGLALDCGAGKIWFAKNGVWNGDPAAGTGGVSISLAAYYAALSFQYGTNAKGTINFGGSAFTYSPPSGFSAWDAASGVTGTASGTFDVTGISAGKVALAAASSGSFAVTGSAAGKVAVAGTVSGSFAVTGSGAGAVANSGAVSGSIGLTGSGAGTVSSGLTGTASGSIAFTGASAGAVAVQGLISGAFTVTGAVAATVLNHGAGSGTIPLTGSATGTVPLAGILGTASGTIDFSGFASNRALVTSPTRMWQAFFA